jgi:hypothetical protein
MRLQAKSEERELSMSMIEARIADARTLWLKRLYVVNAPTRR